jgi:signal transduction histidine kinase
VNAPDQAAPQGNGERPASILVVDDRLAELQILVAFLREEGFLVRPVTSGAAALDLASRARPDLVLLDVHMPGMDGYEVCRRLRADPALRDVPVLFLSALSEPIDKLRAFEVGGEDYIAKPFYMEEVRARIRTHLRLARYRADLEESCRRLREVETMRERLVHMLVHDMRSPLFGISGMLEMAGLCQGVAGDADAARWIHDARETARALIEMISGILDVYKMESGASIVCTRPVSFAAVLTEAQRLLGGVAGRCRLTVCACDAWVRCDPSMTARVLLNLVANAAKFSPPGGLVQVEARAEETALTVSVIDAGPGVRPEDQSRVFEKFGQTGADGGRRYSTGLGLVFCKMVVEAQGGTIGVESHPGAGSRFWFTVPLAPRPAAEAAG